MPDIPNGEWLCPRCTVSGTTSSQRSPSRATFHPFLRPRHPALPSLAPTLCCTFVLPNKELSLPLSFLFLLCAHPEVSCAEGPCSEDLALAMGGAACGTASTAAGRRESRRPTSSSSSRQIRARILCQVGGAVLLALLLGQGAPGTEAFPVPMPRVLLPVSYSGHPAPLSSLDLEAISSLSLCAPSAGNLPLGYVPKLSTKK